MTRRLSANSDEHMPTCLTLYEFLCVTVTVNEVNEFSGQNKTALLLGFWVVPVDRSGIDGLTGSTHRLLTTLLNGLLWLHSFSWLPNRKTLLPLY